MTFHGSADARRAAIQTARIAAGVGDEAELRGEHDLVPAALDGPADELLVVEGTVGLSGVEQGDAEFEGRWIVRMDSASSAAP